MTPKDNHHFAPTMNALIANTSKLCVNSRLTLHMTMSPPSETLLPKAWAGKFMSERVRKTSATCGLEA